MTDTEVVCLAVQLILDGDLDNRVESELADQCGVSGRHLRRLFNDNLGITPAHLARATRIRRAIHLLSSTDRTVADVAFAAGFGSVRQLNRVCRGSFGLSPGELRRNGWGRDVDPNALTLTLPLADGLDWRWLTGHLARWAVPGVEYVSPGVYARTIAVEGHVGSVELSPLDATHVSLTVRLEDWSELVHVVSRAALIVSPSNEHLPKFGTLSPVPPIDGRQRDLAVPGTWDPFETALTVIVADLMPPSFATKAMRRLVMALGARVQDHSNPQLTHVFPPPEAVASADLGRIGFDPWSEVTVRKLSRRVVDRDIPLDRDAAHGGLVKALQEVVGVRAETAHYIALRLGHPASSRKGACQSSGWYGPGGSFRAVS